MNRDGGFAPRPLQLEVCTQLAASERAARGRIFAEAVAALGGTWRDFRVEGQVLVDEQIALLFVAEPRSRQAIATEASMDLACLRRFVWSRIGDVVVRSCVLRHRRGAWAVWATESAERREMECRQSLECQFVVALDHVRAQLRAVHDGIGSTWRQRAAEAKEWRHRRLEELYTDRARGALAVMLADFQLAHQAARSRLEWAEELGRRNIIDMFALDG